jgi:trehalose-phosphatase
MALPTAATLEALTNLAADPRNLVWIISGRDGDFLEQNLGHIDNIGFSAEHGGFLRERGSKEWKNLTNNLDMTWMSDVLDIFKYYTEVRPCFGYVCGRWLIFLVSIENYGQSYRGEEEFDNVAL